MQVGIGNMAGPVFDWWGSRCMFCRPVTGAHVPGCNDLRGICHPSTVDTKLCYLDRRVWYDGKCCIPFPDGCNCLQAWNWDPPPSVSANFCKFEAWNTDQSEASSQCWDVWFFSGSSFQQSNKIKILLFVDITISYPPVEIGGRD